MYKVLPAITLHLLCPKYSYVAKRYRYNVHKPSKAIISSNMPGGAPVTKPRSSRRRKSLRSAINNDDISDEIDDEMKLGDDNNDADADQSSSDNADWHADYKFVDKIILQVKGGKGGNGCISHDMPSPGKKIPTGGNGGRGGDVYIVADTSLVSLNFQTFHFHASDGNHGKGDSMTGRKGADMFIPVPLGTLVYEHVDDEDDDDGWYEDDEEAKFAREFEEEAKWKALEKAIKNDEDVQLKDDQTQTSKGKKKNESSSSGVYEINKADDILLVASGGAAGSGNQAMKGTLTRRKQSMPATNIPGQPGQTRSLMLELKLIADVGLVGYPNAGKSSLLRVLSNAKPKVASYAFTTLHPSVGIVEYSDFERITVADIPGLIDGAHRGRGLGHDFLRHIERTKVLLFVVDVSGSDDRPPDRDLKHLVYEIRRYNPDLLDKPLLVFGNKTDLTLDDNQVRMLKYSARKLGLNLVLGSTSSLDGIPELASKLRKLKESISTTPVPETGTVASTSSSQGSSRRKSILRKRI